MPGNLEGIHMELTEIKLEDIRPNPNNPRRDWGDIDALRRSIADIGLLNPLVVVRDGNVYRLVAGERRFRAIKEIPHAVFCQCLVADDMDEANEMVALMGDNAYRKDFSDDEAARGVQQMLVLGIGEEKVSGASGHDREEIADFKKALGIIWKKHPGRTLSFSESFMLADFDGDEEAIDELLDADIMHLAYDRLRRERDRRERVKRSTAEIEESGATIIPYEDYRQMDYTQKIIYVDGERIGKDGCGCDGFSASLTNWGDAEYFCTKPENHRSDPDSDPEVQERRAREQRWGEEQNARADFIISKMLGTDGGVVLTWWMQEAVSALLGGAFDTLTEGADEIPERTFFRICVAWAWSKSEASLYTIYGSDSEWNDSAKERFAAMLLGLHKVGYELSEEEEEALLHCRKVLESRKEKK